MVGQAHVVKGGLEPELNQKTRAESAGQEARLGLAKQEPRTELKTTTAEQTGPKIPDSDSVQKCFLGCERTNREFRNGLLGCERDRQRVQEWAPPLREELKWMPAEAAT